MTTKSHQNDGLSGRHFVQNTDIERLRIHSALALQDILGPECPCLVQWQGYHKEIHKTPCKSKQSSTKVRRSTKRNQCSQKIAKCYQHVFLSFINNVIDKGIQQFILLQGWLYCKVFFRLPDELVFQCNTRGSFEEMCDWIIIGSRL